MLNFRNKNMSKVDSVFQKKAFALFGPTNLSEFLGPTKWTSWIGNESNSVYLLLTFLFYLEVLNNSERDLGHS